MARTTRTHWLEEGLIILRESGEAGLTVERLCVGLDRTKGSFYHHFRDMEAYLDGLLEHWEAKHTSAPILAAAAGIGFAERRRRLDESVLALDMKLDVSVRAWALRDPRARSAVLRVDTRRIDYLTELYALAHGKGPLARQLADLEYAAFVGAQQLLPGLSGRRSHALHMALKRAIELLAADAEG